MIKIIWAMTKNDLAIWWRSPAALAAALLPAIGMGILVAMLTGSVGQQPVALVVEGHGRFAHRFAEILKGDTDAYLLTEMSSLQAERAIAQQRAAGVIVVPENFDQAVPSERAIVDLYINNVNIDVADDLRRSVARSVAEFDAPQLGLLGEENGPSVGELIPNPYRVAIAEHDLRKTTVSFLQYQVVPVLILIIISIGLFGTAFLTARDFENKTMKLLLLSPAGRLPLVMGRLLSGAILTATVIIPLFVVGFLDHHLPICDRESMAAPILKFLASGPCGFAFDFPKAIGALGLLLLSLTVTMSAIGIMVGLLFRRERMVVMVVLNLASYLFFLGGGFTTTAFLPSPLRQIAGFLPTSYAVAGIRQILFYTETNGLGLDLEFLVGSAVMAVGLASYCLNRSWRHVA